MEKNVLEKTCCKKTVGKNMLEKNVISAYVHIPPSLSVSPLASTGNKNVGEISTSASQNVGTHQNIHQKNNSHQKLFTIKMFPINTFHIEMFYISKWSQPKSSISTSKPFPRTVSTYLTYSTSQNIPHHDFPRIKMLPRIKIFPHLKRFRTSKLPSPKSQIIQHTEA